MRKCNLRTLLIIISVLQATIACAAREVRSLDNGWRFQLGEITQANERDFADREWRVVNLPHDWSIEGTTDASAPSQADGGYFPTGVGWYRRNLEVNPGWRDKRLWLDFEGVATSCQVWLNGKIIGEHHYAYTPIHIDITDHVDFTGPNVIAVRVDNSKQPNSRWYTGSGIYRHVWLTVVEPVHFIRDSLAVVTRKAGPSQAVVSVSVAINELAMAHDAQVELGLIGSDGRPFEGKNVTEETASGVIEREFWLDNPRLWSPDDPQLYTVIARLKDDAETIDELSLPCGVRAIELSPDKGFLLNGKSVELCGACVHHDNGPLGAAAFDRAEERRVELLKAAGFNAIRTAHNPPSSAFLNACDRLGMLVIDEAFDGWAAAKKKYDYSTVFDTQWRNDLRAMIQRDRNHPSVVMWSIGNEVFERGNENGQRIVRELADEVRKLDSTRPVTIGLNSLQSEADWPQLDPMFASVDAAGYNYQIHQHAKDHRRVPQRVIYCSESYARSAYESWEAAVDYPYVIGDFVWSGIDYLGEAGIGRVFSSQEELHDFWEEPQFPWHGGACGDLDITGQRKPLSHYRQILWNRGARLAMAVEVPSPDGRPWQLSKWAHPPLVASWTWPGYLGKELKIVVFSRYDAVRLYLDEQLIGEQPTTRAQQFRASFMVPYAAGTLRAVGIDGGQEAEHFELETAGNARAIRLDADRNQLDADGQDLLFVAVGIVDERGNLRPDADSLITYELHGPGEIVAVGSGDLRSRHGYQANPRNVFQGRALVIIRTTPQAGLLTLTARAPGLETATVEIESVSVP